MRIGGEGFARGQLPLFGREGGKIGIHVFGSGIYLGQRKAVGQWQRIAIDAVTADDEHLFICTAGRECCLQRWEHFRARKGKPLLVREDDIAAVGQRALGQGLKGAAAHNDGMACGQGFEALEVGAQVKEEAVLVADAAVAVEGGDYC